VAGPGGGIFNDAGTLRLNASTVTGNASEGGEMSAGGGIASGTTGNGPVGTLVLNATSVTGNTTTGGGGILNHGGTATLNGSRVSGNSAANGGGIASGPGNPTSPVTSSSLTLNGRLHRVAARQSQTRRIPICFPAKRVLGSRLGSQPHRLGLRPPIRCLLGMLLNLTESVLAWW
jgi:hypothetical protein